MAARLKREQSAYAAMGFTEMGIFWDWMSLWQRDGSMWRPFMYRPDEKLTAKQRTAKQRYVTSRVCRACPLWNPRQYFAVLVASSAHPSNRPPPLLTPAFVPSWQTEEEERSIQWSLTESMDLWYAHHGTTCFLLTGLPFRFASRRPSYADSGWCADWERTLCYTSSPSVYYC